MEDTYSLITLYKNRFGTSSSLPFLNSEHRIFQSINIEGIIPYRLDSDCAIVFGDPLSSLEHRFSLMEAFNTWCTENHLSIIYLLCSEIIAETAAKEKKGISLEIGTEFFLTPNSTPTKGRQGRGLRGKLKHATENNLTFHEYTTHNLDLEKTLQTISDTWITERNGPQIYTSSGNLFNEREHMRWFYASHQGKIVGVLLAQALPAQNGWIIRRIPILKEAPVGTSEYLIYSTWKQLNNEGFTFLSLSFAQRSTIGKITGYKPLTSFFVRFIFKIATRLFHLDHRRQYWEKFQPELKPSYLFINKFSLKNIKALMHILNVHMTNH